MGIAAVNCCTISKPVQDKKLQALYDTVSRATCYSGGLSPEERKIFEMEEAENEKKKKKLEEEKDEQRVFFENIKDADWNPPTEAEVEKKKTC